MGFVECRFAEDGSGPEEVARTRQENPPHSHCSSPHTLRETGIPHTCHVRNLGFVPSPIQSRLQVEMRVTEQHVACPGVAAALINMLGDTFDGTVRSAGFAYI